MPIIAVLFGGLDFNNYFFGLSSTVTAPTLEAAKAQGATFAYGSFITVLIQFLIIAFILFQLVKVSNRLKRAEPPAPPPAASTTDVLLTEIRDALVTAKKK
jgi:large conductance mechanosensitive channel